MTRDEARNVIARHYEKQRPGDWKMANHIRQPDTDTNLPLSVALDALVEATTSKIT